MTAQGWRELVLQVVNDYHSGDASGLTLLTKLLAEQDQAKQVLREKGYSWIGLGWLETVEQIPQNWS